MPSKTKIRKRGLKLCGAAALLTLAGAGLPLLLLHSGWNVPDAAPAALELAGLAGLGLIFLELALLK